MDRYLQNILNFLVSFFIPNGYKRDANKSGKFSYEKKPKSKPKMRSVKITPSLSQKMDSKEHMSTSKETPSLHRVSNRSEVINDIERTPRSSRSSRSSKLLRSSKDVDPSISNHSNQKESKEHSKRPLKDLEKLNLNLIFENDTSSRSNKSSRSSRSSRFNQSNQSNQFNQSNQSNQSKSSSLFSTPRINPYVEVSDFNSHIDLSQLNSPYLTPRNDTNGITLRSESLDSQKNMTPRSLNMSNGSNRIPKYGQMLQITSPRTGAISLNSFGPTDTQNIQTIDEMNILTVFNNPSIYEHSSFKNKMSVNKIEYLNYLDSLNQNDQTNQNETNLSNLSNSEKAIRVALTYGDI